MLWRWLPENPADRILKPSYHATRRDVWDAAQVGHFLAASDGHPCGPLWRVAIASGCRLSELCGLTWADVDLDSGLLAVRRNVQRIRGAWVTSSPKTRAGERTILLPRDGVAALRRQRAQQAEWRLRAGEDWQDTGWVFSGRHGAPLHPRVPQDALLKLCQRLGLPPVTPHGLRHLHASVLLAEGLPLPAVSARLGHADPSITARVYSHALREQDQQAAALLQRVLAPDPPAEAAE